jgi:hypothetical protein
MARGRLFEEFQISRVMPGQFPFSTNGEISRDRHNSDNCHKFS